MPSDLSLRGPDGAVAISGRQLRFRRERPVIRPSTARLPRRFAPRNDTSGGAVVHQCPPAVEFSCTRRSTPVKGHAASVRRQSRQRLRSERRYRRNWCMPFSRRPVPIVTAPPGGACPRPYRGAYRFIGSLQWSTVMRRAWLSPPLPRANDAPLKVPPASAPW